MKPALLRLLIRWALITASLSALLLLAAGTAQIASIRHYLVQRVFKKSLFKFIVETKNPSSSTAPKECLRGPRDDLWRHPDRATGCPVPPASARV